MNRASHAAIACLGSVALGVVSMGARARGADAPAPGALNAVVSIPPLAGLVRPLLPEGAKVTVLSGPGQSEHGFELTPGNVDALARADVVFLVGLGMEPQVERVLDQTGKGGSAPRHLLRFADVAGDKGAKDGAERAGRDPHLWLDPRLAGKFIAAAEEELLATLTERGASSAQAVMNLKAARASMTRTIDQVESDYQDALEPMKGAWLVTAHDAFGRLAARFGLRTLSIRQGGEGAEPTPAGVAEAAKLIKERGVKAIFAEPQTDGGALQRLADATGVKVLTLDPLGDGDWFKMMRANLDALREGLVAPSSP